MTCRYALVIMTLLISTNSFASSAVLPPLPGQQSPAVAQDSAKPPPSTLTEPTSPAPPDADKQTPTEPSPSATQISPQVPVSPQEGVSPAPTEVKAGTEQVEPTPSSSMPTTPSAPVIAPTPAAPLPASDTKKPTGNPQTSQEENESFIDTGQKQLPRVGQGDKNTTSDGYNASDLRIPAIESTEKDTETSSLQSDSRASVDAAQAVPEAAQSAPAAHVGPDIALPEATPSVQAPASVVPSATAQTPPPQPPSPTSEVVTAAPASSASSQSAAATAPAQADGSSVVSVPDTVVTAPATSQTSPPAPTVSAPAASVAPAQVDAQSFPSAQEAITTVPGALTSPPPTVPAAIAPESGAAKDLPVSAPAVPALPVQHSKKMDVSHKRRNQKARHGFDHEPDAIPLTADQIKFINDEAIVFTLAADDVELGELTEEAKISQMPAYDYIKLFWKNYKTPRDKMHKRDVDLFLAMYETHPSAAYEGAMDYDEASTQAFDAACSGKLSDLRAIISYYPVLQMRDAHGDNMLGAAIESDRLEIARFLLVRGIDLYATNYEGYNAFDIARDENNEDASILLAKARFLGRR